MPKNQHNTNIRELGILMIKLFPIILTGTFLSTVLFTFIFFPKSVILTKDLWVIAIMAVLTTLTSLVYCTKKEPSRRKMLVLQIIQTFLIFLIVFTTIYLMNWMNIQDFRHILVLALLTIIVTAATWLWTIHRDKKTTEILNQKLREYQGDDNHI